MSKAILLPPSTTANAIVTGASAELTNIFLQQLSIVAYRSICEGSPSSSAPLPAPVPLPSPSAEVKCDDDMGQSLPTWLDEVKFAWSVDGEDFSNITKTISTNLQDDKRTKLIEVFDMKMVDVNVKSLRIYPLKWKSDYSCLRFSLHSFTAMNIADTAVGKSEPVNSQKCIDALILLRNTTEVLAVATDYITKIEELAATRRQELAMQKMESIVDEKLALEQALLDEKLALNSEKSSLEEQLKTAMEKLRDMEKALVREKSYREQKESMCNSLEEEKKTMLKSLQEHSEVISDSQTQLLKLQATVERDNKLIEILRNKNEDDQKVCDRLNAELKKVKDEQSSLFADRDDLMNQVEVLTEERDDARRNEEELFDILGERTNDLEKLQESYVNMTDRCNDYQDDICDLQESISSLKTLLVQPPVSNKGKATIEG